MAFCLRSHRIKSQPRELLDLSGFRLRSSNCCSCLGCHSCNCGWINSHRDIILLKVISLKVFLLDILLPEVVLLEAFFVHVYIYILIDLHLRLVAVQAQPGGSFNTVRIKPPSYVAPPVNTGWLGTALPALGCDPACESVSLARGITYSESVLPLLLDLRDGVFWPSMPVIAGIAPARLRLFSRVELRSGL